MSGPDSPWVLRDYALLADGERGALIGPRGNVVWMCAPRWHDEAVFAELIGGPGAFSVSPDDPWNVWGGFYEDGTLIYVNRWIHGDGVTECRQALAMPAETGRAVLLRRVRALRGDARVRLRLDVRAGFGGHAMHDLRHHTDLWHARSGALHVRLLGAPDAVPHTDGSLITHIDVPEGQQHDVVLEVSDAPDGRPLIPAHLWDTTERAWADAVPDCATTAAPRDTRQAYAVLRGLTSTSGGMVAAATTSLPERATSNRNYDYRYAWIRDQCYAGIAVATHTAHPLADTAVRFVTERVLADGPRLRPVYTVDGHPLPEERQLTVRGYPGGGRRVGNRAGGEFQLDVFGEVLDLFATVARRSGIDDEAVRAAGVAARAIEEHWQAPDAGLWELEPAWWTHSRLIAVTGLRAAAAEIPGADSTHWRGLADAIWRETERCCRHPGGAWKRSSEDEGPDAALLRPLARGCQDPATSGLSATRQAVERHLTSDGYVYRFRYRDHPLGQDEGAFLLCGFLLCSACLTEGRTTQAARWFERTRAACGPSGLFAEEYDVAQRQLRGNLPQAFVHAVLLENSVRLAAATA
ncbi:glycoside hydrolase [Wenjunlia vitaminophila]|uniref:Glycoside hydrolase n=1 Tax=Wenjunlia vitaminophila TaxID=76728 RepID=A0A0T6LQP0_WENVI|nr:glycoside hydrolase family 15 protein [Wenjunlia vitaminophila]KRV48435.1 glycoside hydrolase [Wenjunlia vitaminophila]